MTSIEEKRSDFILSSDDKCSLCKCHNGVNICDGIKLLLLFLGVSLSFFLGSLSALRMDWSCSSDRQLMGNTSRNKDDLSSSQKLIKSHPCQLSMDGWTAYDRNCYFFSSKKQTWFESRRSCEALDAHLITINEEKEHVFIVSHVKESFWIGLNDLDTEGRWVWVNNQTLNETGVQFWHKRNSSSEPDNWKVQDPSGENCVCLGDVLKPPNIWFDYSCRHELKFICEKKYTSLFKDEE